MKKVNLGREQILVVLITILFITTLSPTKPLEAQTVNGPNTETETNNTMDIIKKASEAASNTTQSAMDRIISGSNPILKELVESEYNLCKAEDTKITPVSNITSNVTQTYTNTSYKFSIQYPSNWQLQENNNCLPTLSSIVKFSAVDEFPITDQLSVDTMMDILSRSSMLWVEVVEQGAPYLDTDTMALKNSTSQQYAQSRLASLSQLPLDQNFREIRQNEFTEAGNPGWKIEYWLNDPSGKSLYNFEVYTVINGKVYTLHYSALPTNVPKSFPLANKMVDSFQVIS